MPVVLRKGAVKMPEIADMFHFQNVARAENTEFNKFNWRSSLGMQKIRMQFRCARMQSGRAGDGSSALKVCRRLGYSNRDATFTFDKDGECVCGARTGRFR